MLDLVEYIEAVRVAPDLSAEVDQATAEEKDVRGGAVKWLHLGIGHARTDRPAQRRQALRWTFRTAGRCLSFAADLV